MTIPTHSTMSAHVAPDPSTAERNPADLVGWARQLSDSADAVARAARTPGAAAGIASALAHIETALAHLERGTDEMEAVARARLTRAVTVLGDPWNHVLVARTTRDFADLARALANARRACEKARRSAGPILAELTAV
jgi:hypothetical protein